MFVFNNNNGQYNLLQCSKSHIFIKITIKYFVDSTYVIYEVTERKLMNVTA